MRGSDFMQRYFINKESHIDLSTNTIIIRGDEYMADYKKSDF